MSDISMRDIPVTETGKRGKVFLVGAGPGDPELLTLKALRLLRTAEAVLHDDLVAPEILKLIPSTAQTHNVGKRCGKKKILQGEINSLMIALAASGLRVVRLKGGDPLIFGRAGEEIESLRRSNIPFEIVPGVTSAMGAAAVAQFPLTHRRASDAVVFLTAHRASNTGATDWKKFAGSGATLVIYMPGQNYSDIARRLTAAGLSLQTPCAVVSRATTKYQRIHRCNLQDLHRTPPLVSPTLLIVGEVVALSAPESLVAGLPIEQLSHSTLPLPQTLRAQSATGVSALKRDTGVVT
jgi:uroporphyrin-III C-methyltransferase